MTIQRRTGIVFFVFLIVSFYAFALDAGSDKFEQAKKYLGKGIDTYNEQLLQDAKKIFIQLCKDNPADYEYAHYTALAYLGLCDLKNFEIAQNYVKKTKKTLRASRIAIAEEGIVYAEKSILLKDGVSESHRVYGALISNRISGMVSGMKNGSLAEEQVNIALALDGNNAMAHIENARMYICKPGLLGGDIDKGIEILNKVVNDNSGLVKGYINLGIAYQENGETEKAINTFKSLLGADPDNPEAKFFLDQLTSVN
ncbi:MAG: tetratricopeptide repeat protein [Candidatus Brocadiaceae bacterium]|nr:tetratricopeptide repeat protein [Candidatus Brocadiaceae bacterium]